MSIEARQAKHCSLGYHIVNENNPSGPKRVLIFGASGTIGQAVVRALLDAGHVAVGVYRSAPKNGFGLSEVVRQCDVTDPASVRREAFGEGRFDAVISCLASRTGAPTDAWLIDYEANRHVLQAAQDAGCSQMILLSAICVQKPRLAFQHAKLAFERELADSGIGYTIIRPTAFFKSLSGQVDRVRQGKPFLLFGNGELTRCKPISDDDLARYIVSTIGNPNMTNRILPIGGPGPAISPRDQGEMLFKLAGREPRYRSISPTLFHWLGRVLKPLGFVSGWFAEKAEYLGIAHYYATESMLVLDSEMGEYSTEATPETGSETLEEHYRSLFS